MGQNFGKSTLRRSYSKRLINRLVQLYWAISFVYIAQRWTAFAKRVTVQRFFVYFFSPRITGANQQKNLKNRRIAFAMAV